MHYFIVTMMLSVASLSVLAAGNPEAGQATAVICTGCHGHDGNSDSPLNPKLAGQHESYLIKQLRDFKSGARKEEHMTSMVEAISMDDIPNLAAWFASQTLKNKHAKSNRIGKKIFHRGIDSKGIAACDGCHGENGRGNAAIGFPSLAGQHAEYVIKQLKDFRMGKRHNDSLMMQSIAKPLSDKEIVKLAEYISSMK
ncbi:MAG: cytochrome c4 [Gammaproteobacteria bacterium]|nr:cytochrome c4 [Gammaproteobacteria bacterium]